MENYFLYPARCQEHPGIGYIQPPRQENPVVLRDVYTLNSDLEALDEISKRKKKK